MTTNTLKQTYIDRAQHHQDADEIVQGLYWEKGKGCCVGCLAHANENAHCELEKQTNIPEWLSRSADIIHEGLTKSESKLWPARFIKAVPEQIFTKKWDENQITLRIKAPFLIMVLESTLENFDHNKFPDVTSAIDGSIALWQREDIGSDDWKSAASAAARAASAAARAASAAASAASEAYSAAYSAASEAASAAASAAASEAYSAASAAYSAARAAYSAAASAASAAARAASEAYSAAASAAYSAAASAKYKYFSDQLVEIMENAA